MICHIIHSSTATISRKSIQEIRDKFKDLSLFHPSLSKNCDVNEVEQVVRVYSGLFDNFTEDYKRVYYGKR